MILVLWFANSSEFKDRGPNCEAAVPPNLRRINMKKLTLSLWLALAAAGMIAIQAMPSKHSLAKHTVAMDDPFPTCPPECPPDPNNK
jgi:hypothetical protein